MVNPAVVSFWLDNKRVNGTSIAEDGPVKLVRYGSKLYVVEGKDAERRSYSQTSLPPKWKKILSAAKASSAAAGTAAASVVTTGAPALSATRQQPSETPAAKKSPVRKSSAPRPEVPRVSLQPTGTSPQPAGTSPLSSSTSQQPSGISQQPSGTSPQRAGISLRPPVISSHSNGVSPQIDQLHPEAHLPSPAAPAKKAITPVLRVRKEKAETKPATEPTPTQQPPASADTETMPDAPAKRGVKSNPKPINQEVETDMSTEKEKAPVAETVNNQTAAAKVKKAKAAATLPAPETEAAPEPAAKAKTAPKAGKVGKARDKAGDLGCSCPYCQHKRDIMLADSELDKPVVVFCAGCGREFVLRVVMTYQVQVAGFI